MAFSSILLTFARGDTTTLSVPLPPGNYAGVPLTFAIGDDGNTAPVLQKVSSNGGVTVDQAAMVALIPLTPTETAALKAREYDGELRRTDLGSELQLYHGHVRVYDAVAVPGGEIIPAVAGAGLSLAGPVSATPQAVQDAGGHATNLKLAAAAAVVSNPDSRLVPLTVESKSRTGSAVAKQLAANVATLTTAAPHNFLVGESVTITGSALAAPFTGTKTITAVPTPTTFSYAAVGADVPSTAVNPAGTATVNPAAVALKIDTGGTSGATLDRLGNLVLTNGAGQLTTYGPTSVAFAFGAVACNLNFAGAALSLASDANHTATLNPGVLSLNDGTSGSNLQAGPGFLSINDANGGVAISGSTFTMGGGLVNVNTAAGTSTFGAMSFDSGSGVTDIGGTLQVDASTASVIVSGPLEVSGALTVDATVILSALPAVDPHVAGQLWNSAGTLKVSAG
jgi:hypothetical protein